MYPGNLPEELETAKLERLVNTIEENFGTRPTVAGRELLLEVHIFDFDAEIYGRRIEVEFVARLREEKKFDGVEAMTEQVRRDAARAREILAATD